MRCEVKTVAQQRIGIGLVDYEGPVWFAVRHHGDWTILLTQRGEVLSADRMAELITDTVFEPV